MSGVRISNGSLSSADSGRPDAGVAELADAPDLGSGVPDVRVRVSSSALFTVSSTGCGYAVVAQLVERHLAKVEVASPSLVYRSIFFLRV